MRFGIIGTNFISDRFVASLPFTDATVTAVLSRKRETGEAFAKKHGIPFVYTDLSDFLASDAFDAVYVASPNALHKEQSIAALRAGKHVLCEKPIAPSLREYEQMRAVANERGLVLLEAMRPVFDRGWQAVRNSLKAIGRIRTVHLDFCQYSSRYNAFLSGRVENAFDPSLSNAALLDIGVYPIAVAVMLFGAPNAVKSHSLFLENGFEGGGSALLSYNSFSVSITYSKVCDSASASVILGEEGSISVDKVSEPLAITLKRRGEEATSLLWEPSEAPDNMFFEIAAFCRMVKEGDSVGTDAISRATLSVMDAIRRENGIRFSSDAR